MSVEDGQLRSVEAGPDSGPRAHRRTRLYCYPYSAKGKSLNPYVERLMEGLSREYDIVNEGRPSENGILDLYRYVFQCDVVLFNWVENVPDRRGGYIQALLVYLILIGKRAFGLQVAWVLHNKLSHSKSNAWLKSTLVQALARHSDVIITHAREGLDYARELDRRAGEKTFFLHHPVEPFAVAEGARYEPDFDVLIWGSMHRYKGVREFLEQLSDSAARDRLRVLVWGRFADDDYYRECVRVSPARVEIRNEMVPDEALAGAQNAARVILFPYSPQSVLSSGALMTSLNSSAVIVGPDTGSFRDLAREGLVVTYERPDEMIGLIERAIAEGGGADLVERRRAFFAAHSWRQQCGEIARLINQAREVRQVGVTT